MNGEAPIETGKAQNPWQLLLKAKGSKVNKNDMKFLVIFKHPNTKWYVMVV
jgi:hypothetical protein